MLPTCTLSLKIQCCAGQYAFPSTGKGRRSSHTTIKTHKQYKTDDGNINNWNSVHLNRTPFGHNIMNTYQNRFQYIVWAAVSFIETRSRCDGALTSRSITTYKSFTCKNLHISCNKHSRYPQALLVLDLILVPKTSIHQLYIRILGRLRDAWVFNL